MKLCAFCTKPATLYKEFKLKLSPEGVTFFTSKNKDKEPHSRVVSVIICSDCGVKQFGWKGGKVARV